MPIGTTNIGLLGLATELGLPTPTGILLSDAYSSSDVDGLSNGWAGSFHNLSMGLSPTGIFRTQIFSPYFTGDNFALNRWANYDHDAPVRLSYTLSSAMVPGRNVRFELYLDSNPGPPTTSASAILFDTVTLFGANPAPPPYTQVDFNTGVAAHSNFWPTGYYITAVISCLPTPFSADMNVVSSTDDDGVGANTDRGNFTQSFPGPWDIVTPFDGVLVDGSAAGTGFPLPIAWNKRTNFSVTIT